MTPPRGLAAEVLTTLADAGRGLTLQQLQTLLAGYHESATLSATMVRLERTGQVHASLTGRTADKGRRRVKCYQLAPPPSVPAKLTKLTPEKREKPDRHHPRNQENHSHSHRFSHPKNKKPLRALQNKEACITR